MVPLHSELQPNHIELQAILEPKSPSHVQRPQARYQIPFNSWPLEPLTWHPQSAAGSGGTIDNTEDNIAPTAKAMKWLLSTYSENILV